MAGARHCFVLKSVETGRYQGSIPRGKAAEA